MGRSAEGGGKSEDLRGFVHLRLHFSFQHVFTRRGGGGGAFTSYTPAISTTLCVIYTVGVDNIKPHWHVFRGHNKSL